MSVQAIIDNTRAPDAHHQDTPEERNLSLAVENMHCGGCLRSVEKTLLALPGVLHARANLSAKRVSVRCSPDRCDLETVIEALSEAGFRAAPLTEQTNAGGDDADRDYLKRLAVAGFAAANIMLLSVSVWSGAGGDMDETTQSLFHRITALIALPTVAYAGQPFFRSAFGALKAGRLNMDVPISLGVILATAMSCFQMFNNSDQVYFEAAVTLLFFLLIGRWLDQRLRTRAQGEAQNLLSLQSGLATVVGADASRTRVPAHTLEPGDTVLIPAGERVPADGTILSGKGDVDQSLITGESAHATICKGSSAYAGTLNLTAPLTMRVTASDDMTLLSEISRLMSNAEQGRAAYRRLADRAARIYAPAVHILGAATFAGWLVAGAGWEIALTYAIAVLIITCPCALALAVPAVQIAAASRLFRHGIILKAADALERLAEADWVVFDKTGTLTLGHPVLLNEAEIPDAQLRAAAALASASSHPYAKAVVEAAQARLGQIPVAQGIEEVPGDGLRRETAKGEERLGSPRWCGVREKTSASLWYRSPSGERIAFRFSEALRPDAPETVQKLKDRYSGVTLLSGDRAQAAEAIADMAGIGDWYGPVNPAEKIAYLKDLSRGHKVLMVGDGLNDAPALAEAHVSISPASAADITQRAADFVFQGEKLGAIVEAIGIAVKARSLAFQNFAIALAYNMVCVPLAVAGYVTPLVAAVAMSTSSILVTANAVRLAGFNKAERT
ncbi:MAG: cadmium-translocating P-type ATPase [Hyphomicrobiaceae bacterium]|nr:cadmium-translocating P-type ATPase [Hyphomicrobiaceae bacterium]